MELFIFFKSKNLKNDPLFDIEFFRYNTLSKEVVEEITKGIDNYTEKCDENNTKPYNPLSLERGNGKLEKITIKDGEIDSDIFKAYRNIIVKSQLKDIDVTMAEKKYRLKSLKKYNDATCPVFYYAIKEGENVFFKKTSESHLLLKNENKIFIRKDNAKEVDIDDLMVIDTRFDFHINNNDIFIKNGTSFESILEYENVFKVHKNKIISKIEEAKIIDDFDAFKVACSKANYFRAFKVVSESTDFKKAFSNGAFLKKLETDTKGKIKWNRRTKKIELEDVHIQTVLHMFSGLIGVDIYNEIVIFNEKHAIPA
ncbi:Kiwa anti-phage protein KwaB-like domain-containing protein [Viridibacillus arvi]|uniref:DUF4868 domain-containing protein n=1 Tax=Viridibacillus arvi TaxID=263475 RepID=A0A0M0LDH2_9BACL|nr:Kiwa anti-phage protein KwaB-like domain-containing protein [Viridibacillus arvi]KOO48773.1 hypothetical protein AMD00_10095 [Viridibacillus arvi]